MRILIDTHILIWVLTDDEKLSLSARKLVQEARGGVFYSVVSLWEVAIKFGYGRLNQSPAEFSRAADASAFRRIAISDEHLTRVAALPMHHRDPFDRMLIAQAETEPLKLVTTDRTLQAYGSAVLVV